MNDVMADPPFGLLVIPPTKRRNAGGENRGGNPGKEKTSFSDMYKVKLVEARADRY